LRTVAHSANRTSSSSSSRIPGTLSLPLPSPLSSRA
jgi:hypothetical protein